MSANRAVQAAQRRRAGGPEPAPPGRGPQPSINSSQMFSQQPQPQQQQQQQQQVRPGTSGRLAGQHAQQMQQQHQQQQIQDPQQAAGIAGISKMTLAQAITLITLRLGKVETQLHEIGHQQMGMDMGMGNNGMMDENGENMALVDKGLIDSIMSRLESLEKRSPSTGASSPDVALLKQQFDGIKMSFAQSTKVNAILTKEQKEHKQQIDALKSELSETKELLNALQTLTMDNSQKIFAIMSGEEVVLDADEDEVQGEVENDVDADAQDDEDEDSELVGTDLKGLIEQELNA